MQNMYYNKRVVNATRCWLKTPKPGLPSVMYGRYHRHITHATESSYKRGGILCTESPGHQGDPVSGASNNKRTDKYIVPVFFRKSMT
jgi:hypothetical protein